MPVGRYGESIMMMDVATEYNDDVPMAVRSVRAILVTPDHKCTTQDRRHQIDATMSFRHVGIQCIVTGR
jgi:hypothetical protein